MVRRAFVSWHIVMFNHYDIIKSYCCFLFKMNRFLYICCTVSVLQIITSWLRLLNHCKMFLSEVPSHTSVIYSRKLGERSSVELVIVQLLLLRLLLLLLLFFCCFLIRRYKSCLGRLKQSYWPQQRPWCCCCSSIHPARFDPQVEQGGETIIWGLFKSCSTWKYLCKVYGCPVESICCYVQ